MCLGSWRRRKPAHQQPFLSSCHTCWLCGSCHLLVKHGVFYAALRQQAAVKSSSTILADSQVLVGNYSGGKLTHHVMVCFSWLDWQADAIHSPYPEVRAAVQLSRW